MTSKIHRKIILLSFLTNILIVIYSLRAISAQIFPITKSIDCPSGEGKFDHRYYFNVQFNSNSCVIQFHYNISKSLNNSKAIRVCVESDKADETYPLLFVIKQQLGIISWQLPLTLSAEHQYNRVCRTLCPIWNYGKFFDGNQQLTLDVSTSAREVVDVDLTLTQQDDFFIEADKHYKFNATPSEPEYFEATFPENVDLLVISIFSNDDVCAVVSIQPIGCPVYDLDKDVQFNGSYQTMTRKAGFTLRAKDFDGRKFYIIFVVKAIDKACSRGMETLSKQLKTTTGRRHKEFDVSMKNKMSKTEYYLATLGAISVFIVFYIISLTISVIYLVKNYNREDDSPMPTMAADTERTMQIVDHGNPPPRYGAINQMDPETSAENAIDSPVSPDDIGSGLDENEYDSLPDADSDKNVLRTKTFLYVSDLARKNCKSLERKSKLYIYIMLIVAIFYGLPVAQLVVTYEQVLHVTGNEDICYYNFLCTYPLGPISDFNHVFSNVGYVLLGFLFIGLVWRRDLLHHQNIALDDQYELYYGIPRHFGLFYAMGLALIMEGVLSGCYHICPNYSNFQFDTAFMYMIAGVCMLKIYQTRHPDINASAYASFLAFAFVIVIGVGGVLYGTSLFWVIFAVIYPLSCLALSAQIYYMGRWRLNFGIFKRIYLTMKTDLMSESRCFRPMYMDRMLLLMFVNAINWAITAYGLVYLPRDFASYLLAIFITNLMMYVGFYIIMKIRSKEIILWLPKLYIALSTVTWAFAIYLFFQGNTSWQLSPAQSRAKNRPCILLNFYDDHDVWHFVSAAGLFFSFMILLTLDDDLVHTPRDQIPVF
uniref:SID1 transmembrane family member 1 n=1 Tax=Strigamia maritima TaxID=126957 RepID=T1IHB1_STRMM